MSGYTRSPAGRVPSIIAAITLLASLPRPAAAFWYSRSCVQNSTGTYTCSGLSYGAGAGIGVSLLLVMLGLIFLVAWINRPPPSMDVEEVWVAPPGVFAVTPLPGQQVHIVQMQQSQSGGVYPWMPSTYRSPYPQQQGQAGVPLAPPPPSPRDPYPGTIPEQTPRSGVMRDVPLNSAREEERRLYDRELGPGGAQDVWRAPGTPGLRIVTDRRDEGRALR